MKYNIGDLFSFCPDDKTNHRMLCIIAEELDGVYTLNWLIDSTLVYGYTEKHLESAGWQRLTNG